MQSLLRQFHKLSKVSSLETAIQCLRIQLQKSSRSLKVASYVFFQVFPSLLSALLSFLQINCFVSPFLRYMPTLQVAFLPFINVQSSAPPRLLLNASSFLTLSVQLIFCILFEHHISKVFRYFRFTFLNVQVSAPHQVVFQMQHFITLFLKSNFSFVVRRFFILLNNAFAIKILDLIASVHLASFLIMLHNS